MVIDPEVIPPSSNRGKRAVRQFPKWAVYGTGGISVFLLIALIKPILPLIGMFLLLALIWSKSKKKSRY